MRYEEEMMIRTVNDSDYWENHPYKHGPTPYPRVLTAEVENNGGLHLFGNVVIPAGMEIPQDMHMCFLRGMAGNVMTYIKQEEKNFPLYDETRYKSFYEFVDKTGTISVRQVTPFDDKKVIIGVSEIIYWFMWANSNDILHPLVTELPRPIASEVVEAVAGKHFTGHVLDHMTVDVIEAAAKRANTSSAGLILFKLANMMRTIQQSSLLKKYTSEHNSPLFVDDRHLITE